MTTHPHLQMKLVASFPIHPKNESDPIRTISREHAQGRPIAKIPHKIRANAKAAFLRGVAARIRGEKVLPLRGATRPGETAIDFSEWFLKYWRRGYVAQGIAMAKKPGETRTKK